MKVSGIIFCDEEPDSCDVIQLRYTNYSGSLNCSAGNDESGVTTNVLTNYI